LKKITRFPNVTKPWVVRAGFDDQLFSGLQQALLELKENGDRIVFHSDILFSAEPDRQPIKLGEVRLGLCNRASRIIIASRIRESVTHTVVIFILL
jgi:hypothetical protein